MKNLILIFKNHKERNLILWLTDMVVVIVSYFYMTRPDSIRRVIEGLDLAKLRPDLDTSFVNSPEFLDLIQRMVMVVTMMTIAIIAVLHTWAFYKCYLRQKSAIAYVKVYTFMAALSLVLWFVNNMNIRSLWILIPAAIYGLVFYFEKQTSANCKSHNLFS